MNKKIVVVGGGAAGMMAAICAAEQGAEVTLLEPNERLGKKLNITGKGRCNVTNNADLETLLANTPKNGKFLYSAFSKFDGRDRRSVQNLTGWWTDIDNKNLTKKFRR
jgi:predicted flavoprotein YhiN